MPFFQLSETDKTFPPAHFADMEGMIAVGGDLSSERLVNAYGNGIFFWFGPMDTVKWWSPDPRLVLFTSDAEEPNGYHYTIDHSFEQLMRACQEIQNSKPMNEFWITEQMASAYLDLHQKGNAHSLEIWKNDDLIGGVFGITVGKLFCAEYLLSKDIEADTFALNQLGSFLKKHSFPLIDLQKVIEDLGEVNFSEISRLEYLDYVTKNNMPQDVLSPWKIN
jgi:leucyl/phenylalanyl-tRNA--protein transferase